MLRVPAPLQQQVRCHAVHACDASVQIDMHGIPIHGSLPVGGGQPCLPPAFLHHPHALRCGWHLCFSLTPAPHYPHTILQLAPPLRPGLRALPMPALLRELVREAAVPLLPQGVEGAARCL